MFFKLKEKSNRCTLLLGKHDKTDVRPFNTPALYFRNLVVLVCCSIFLGPVARAQESSTINNQFGIWQYFGEPISKTVLPELNGRLCNFFWKDLEPEPGVWVWDAFDADLAARAMDSLPIIFMVYTKDDAPDWLYTNGVPKVIERNDAGDSTGYAPYYADADYKYYFKRMITTVRQHVETLPDSVRDKIIGVQGCFGSTGDYISYKGKVDPKYDLDWWDFFTLFKEFSKYYYNEYLTTNPKITLLSNPPNSNGQDQTEWLVTNCPGSWLKCGTMGKGYQLNDELSKSKWLFPILNTPQSGDYMRSRSEIIHDGLLAGWWDDYPYRNMFSIMTYAIHWGLDWSNQGYEQIINHLYDSSFSFYNKYAGKKDPLTAKHAMVALKDVIDAADKVRFPESVYGKAEKTANRFESVLAPFIPYGARLEDLSSALQSENENVDAKGINDVGWDLFPGNYERFLRQINPNGSSTGYWNVESIDTTSMYGRFARGFELAKGKTALYFDISNQFLNNAPLNAAYPVIIDVVYLDKGTGKWQLVYDARSGANTVALTMTCTNTGLWKKASLTIRDALFDNRALNASDFFIRSAPGNTQDVLFALVELTRPNDDGSDIGLFTTTLPAFDTICVNSESEPKAITVSGSFLSASSVVVGPRTGFLFSLSPDGIYTDSVIIGGIQAAFRQTVYVKFSPKREGGFNVNLPIKGGANIISLPAVAAAVNSSPSLSSTVSNVTCFGFRNGAVDLNLTGGTGPFIFSWTSNSSNYRSSTEDIADLPPATYTVQLSAYAGCRITASYTITQPLQPLEVSVTYDSLICKGGTTKVYVNASGGTTPYTGTGVFTVDAGYQGYQVSDSNGCILNKGVFVNNGSIAVPLRPEAIISPVADQLGICPSDVYRFNVAQVDGVESYVWSSPAGTRIEQLTPDGSSIALITRSAFSGGSLSVAARNVCGTSSARIRQLTSTPVRPDSIYGPTVVKRFQTGLQFSVVPVPGLTYTWVVPASARIVSGQNTPSVIVDWGGGDGNVNVKSDNGCALSPSKLLFVRVSDGSFAAATTAGVSEPLSVVQETTGALMVYPNPAKNITYLRFTAIAPATYTVRITDLTGKTMQQYNLAGVAGVNQVPVRLGNMASGLYIVQLSTAGQPVQTTKLVVQ